MALRRLRCPDDSHRVNSGGDTAVIAYVGTLLKPAAETASPEEGTMNFRNIQAIKKFIEARNTKRSQRSSNFNSYSTNESAIDAAADYSLHVARSYLNHFLSHGIDVHGKRILEIGPGTNFGAIFILKALGANQVVEADRYLVEYDDTFHSALYNKLLSKVHKEFPEANTELIETAVQERTHSLKNFSFYKCGLEDMSTIPDKSFDIIVSNAVLEHLKDPVPAFAELARVTKTDGYGFHLVDFRNHNDFARPLEFLLMPEDEQVIFIMARNYSCGNGWRVSEYKKLFEQNSFSVETLLPSKLAEGNYFSQFISRLKDSGSRYVKFAEEDQHILTAHLL